MEKFLIEIIEIFLFKTYDKIHHYTYIFFLIKIVPLYV